MDKHSYNLARLISVIRQMGEGKILTLKDGRQLAMGVDYSIGYLVTKEDTETGLVKESITEVIGLEVLHKLLVESDIHPVEV